MGQARTMVNAASSGKVERENRAVRGEKPAWLPPPERARAKERGAAALRAELTDEFALAVSARLRRPRRVGVSQHRPADERRAARASARGGGGAAGRASAAPYWRCRLTISVSFARFRRLVVAASPVAGAARARAARGTRVAPRLCAPRCGATRARARASSEEGQLFTSKIFR